MTDRHAAGTPIEEARNIGPKTAEELRSIGIASLEALRALRWEAAFERLVRSYPERLNLNMACSLIGAIDDVDWRNVSGASKAHARAFVRQLGG